MTDSHQAVETNEPPAHNRRRAEGGYVIAQTALLMIPLMIFAAFATDIGFWYVQGQKAQRAVDAAALAGVPLLPDVDAAAAEARAVAARNGYIDATPADNNDFLTGPLPQVEVSVPVPGTLEVKVRREESSFLGRVVLDSITVERFAVAEFVAPVYLGNPSSGLGTGTIPQSNLGVPSDNTWLAVNAYCYDKENGDQFLAGYFDGPVYNGLSHRQCGSSAGSVQSWANVNPTFDPDAYVFVAEMQPGSPPIDLSLFEPGHNCDPATNTLVTGEFNSSTPGPRIYYRVYGPSTSQNHRGYLNSAAPIATGLFPRDACYNNAPNGDGWWPMATGLSAPGPEGGFYYVRLSTRNPALPDLDPADSYWQELFISQFSFKATYSGSSSICIYSSADPTCPQLYGLDWLPLYRNLAGSEAEFFLTEIYDSHAGSTFIVRFFDAAEGVANLQVADPSGTAQPFRWRYVDESVGQMSGSPYRETSFQNYTNTCSWAGVSGNPCLRTSNRSDWNDHMVEIAVDVPPSYTC
ncbi:MAG: Tad domain-containing protein, partial [Acidimicrobiia bacterium]|nr:Tad domain-containing protein [Acidimicrobiia bacterium]